MCTAFFSAWSIKRLAYPHAQFREGEGLVQEACQSPVREAL
jgi:hypothetical protein